MKKIVLKGEELRQASVNAVNELAEPVASTLGPKGQNVLLKNKGKPCYVTKDGVTVAREFGGIDPVTDAIAEIVKQASHETNTNAGDGTTTSTVLARATDPRIRKCCSSYPIC